MKTNKVMIKNPRLTSPLAILIAARDRLIEHGWCRFVEHKILKNGKHLFCAQGAMRSVAYDHQSFARARNHLEAVFDDGEGIADWNDRKGRRKRDVIAAFNRAIKQTLKLNRNS